MMDIQGFPKFPWECSADNCVPFTAVLKTFT